jgi:hypothetical protein
LSYSTVHTHHNDCAAKEQTPTGFLAALLGFLAEHGLILVVSIEFLARLTKLLVLPLKNVVVLGIEDRSS